MSRKRRGRSEGSIYRKSAKLWAASASLGYDERGKRKRKTLYGQTKQEVQEKLRQMQQDAALGRLTDAEKFTVEDFLTLWLDNTVRVKVSPTTHARYEQHARLHVYPDLGRIKLAKLTSFHVADLYARMEKAGDSAAERQKSGKLLRQALRHAVNLGLIQSNPASRIPLPKVTKEEIHPLDREQSSLFLEKASEDRLYAMYMVALDSGMRQGELFGLQWPDINFETGSVQVQRSMEEIKGRLRLKELKTKAARRRIRLSAFALDALHEHRKRMLAEGHDVKNGPVFCDTEGKWLRKSNVQRRSFDRIVKKAGLPESTRFHDLRHTCATLLLMADVNVKVVSERLGHSKIQITLDTYQHVLPTMQEKAADALNTIFQAAIS